jgi:integrase
MMTMTLNSIRAKGGGQASITYVQYLTGHADPRTTRLYDRRQKKVIRNVAERISVYLNITCLYITL